MLCRLSGVAQLMMKVERYCQCYDTIPIHVFKNLQRHPTTHIFSLVDGVLSIEK
jgi:hypothetical protein